MKNIIYAIAIMINALFYCANLQAQITLENQYNIFHKVFYVTDIGNSDYKYVISDSIGFSLYNLDHTPYLLNVVSPIPLWTPPAGYEISYISKSLFDCDSSNIEFVITQWSAPANYYIYRTDGTLLFEKDSVTGYFNVAGFDGTVDLNPIENTPDGTKLFLCSNKAYVERDSLYVFSLCGTLPSTIGEIPLDNNFVNLYPNPTSGVINFQFKESNPTEKFELCIYNSSCQKVDAVIINQNSYQLNLKEKALSEGIYLYELKAGTKVYQTGKFVITK